MTTTANHRAVRTKTGSKVHLAFGSSSRTFCGARVAIVLKSIDRRAVPCEGCGLDATMSAETLAQWLDLPIR